MDKIIYNERKNKGLCPMCGSPANDGYVMCKGCRTIRQKKKEAKRLLGLCVDCNAPTKRGTNLCEECSEKAAEIKRKQRAVRIQRGVCSRCGGEREEGYATCSKCREYSREIRDAYIQYGLCSRCHKEPVYGDERTCPECRVERRKINAKYRKSHREELNEKQKVQYKIRYENRKEQGICTRCGKNKATDGKFTCRKCRNKDSQLHQLRYQPALIDKPNRCRFCNNDSMVGYKVCEKHQKKMADVVKIRLSKERVLSN